MGKWEYKIVLLDYISAYLDLSQKLNAIAQEGRWRVLNVFIGAQHAVFALLEREIETQ
jgi:hypothetical protein